MFLSDARDYQILILGSFLFLGILTRDWTVQPQFIFAAIASCILTQLSLTFFLDFVKSKKEQDFGLNRVRVKSYQKFRSLAIGGLRSAAITGLGLSLLLRTNDYNTMALAGCLAIASKFFLRVENKHFFNPANFGIIAVLILTNNAWVSPGQWGTDWWYLLLFIGLGGIVLKKVGRWDTSAVFLTVYAGLEALRNLWLGWDLQVWQHQLTSGSLLLFALFMLTDPRSIPNARSSRIIWAIAIAVVTFILRDYFYISTAIFWALFFISPLTILCDRIWQAPRFNWQILESKKLIYR